MVPLKFTELISSQDTPLALINRNPSAGCIPPSYLETVMCGLTPAPSKSLSPHAL